MNLNCGMTLVIGCPKISSSLANVFSNLHCSNIIGKKYISLLLLPSRDASHVSHKQIHTRARTHTVYLKMVHIYMFYFIRV